MLFLTDNQEAGELYKYEKECDCQLYTFPFNEKEGAKYFLYVLKHGKFCLELIYLRGLLAHLCFEFLVLHFQCRLVDFLR